MPQYKNSSENGFIHILILVAAVTLGGLIGSANISITKEFPKTLAFQDVLGEDEEGEEREDEEKVEEAAKQVEKQEKEQEKEQKEKQKEEQKQQREILKKQEDRKESNIFNNLNLPKTKIQTDTLTRIKSKTQSEGNKSETEIETLDGQKIKTKVEDNGTTKVEIEHGQLKLKYVVENGLIKLKAENEQGQDVELEDDELDEVENELEVEGIKIATGSGKPIFVKNNMAALTDFPLSIDVGSNQLIVTTPTGQKVVTVLPDQAVQNLLATKIISKIEQVSDPISTPDLERLDGLVKLEVRNNDMVYRIKGVKTHNLLGFIPVDTTTTVFVSADTGQPVAQDQAILSNIIDFLSP